MPWEMQDIYQKYESILWINQLKAQDPLYSSRPKNDRRGSRVINS